MKGSARGRRRQMGRSRAISSLKSIKVKKESIALDPTSVRFIELVGRDGETIVRSRGQLTSNGIVADIRDEHMARAVRLRLLDVNGAAIGPALVLKLKKATDEGQSYCLSQLPPQA